MRLPLTSCQYLWPSESLNSFLAGTFKLNTKLDGDLLLYSLSHFECEGHTGHVLTQQCLLPPLTSTVKSSLMHVRSGPIFLATSLRRYHANCSHMLTVAGLFPDRPCVCVCTYTCVSIFNTCFFIEDFIAAYKHLFFARGT